MATQKSSGNSRRILATVAAIGALGAIGGLGTYSLFTDSVTAGTQSVASGTLDIAKGSTDTLTVGATAIVPGDVIQRPIDITNAGSTNFGGVTVTTAVNGTSSLLDSDATNGLQMRVDKCSVAWVETPAGSKNYTCSGTTSAVVASRAVIGTAVAMSNMASVTAGSTDNLKVTLSLPTSADNTFQNLSTAIDYTFTASQRTGTNK